MPRTAEIIAVGSELLTGGVTNTNAAFLSRLLTAAGVEVLYHTTVDDDAARLEKAVTIARGRAELLVFTGGLGPTYDDMTKTAVCAALDTPLVFHPEVVEDMRRYFDRVFRRETDMTLAPYAKPGEVMLQLSARGADESACEARMAPVLAEVRARLGAYFYGADVSGLEETVLTLCRERGLTLAAAESCTGGLIAKRLTDIPGASQVFLGGVVSYTNHVKQQVLHVPENLLARCGAVSAEVARAMALGVRVLTGADLAVSVTGLAGPDGDDRGNPVGTVFVGLSAPEGVTVRHLTLGGDRERIRTLSAHHAFDMLRRYLTNLPTEGE